MGKDLNEVTLIARLVADPEIKYSATGTPIVKMSVANNDAYTKDNQKVEYVSFIDVSVFGNQAINCEKYLKKGSQIALTGRLKQERWQDQATGQTRSKIVITANTIQFLSPANNQGNGQQQQNQVPNTMSTAGTKGMYQQNQQAQGNQNNQPQGNNQPEVISDPWGPPSQQQQNAQGGYPQNSGNQQQKNSFQPPTQQQQDNYQQNQPPQGQQQPMNNEDDIPF